MKGMKSGICIVISVILASCGLLSAADLTLVKDGKPNAVIIAADEAQAQTAAVEIQKYLEKMSGLIGLLNNGYNSSGYYQENGHDIFSELIEGLKVEIKDLREIILKEDIEIVSDISNKIKIETEEESNNFKRENLEEEVPRVRNEEVKSKIKGML